MSGKLNPVDIKQARAGNSFIHFVANPMRVLIARLSGSLRGTFTQACFGSHSLLRSSRLPVVSASSAFAGILVASEFREMTNTESWQHSQSRFQDVAQASLSKVSSVRDVPLLVTEAVSGAYTNVKKSVLRRIDTEGGSTVFLLTAANLGIYFLWKTAPTPFMVR